MESENNPTGKRRPYVIDVSVDAGPLDLDSYLSSLDANSKQGASSFVFRVTPELNAKLALDEGATARSDLLRRVTPGLPIQSLILEAGIIRLFRVAADGLIAEPQVEIFKVQQADLQRLVEQHGDDCYYQSNPKHHYVAPSMNHCSAFFRLGDAIRSHDALDRLTFWLRPYISTSDAILVDTWSIAALTIRAQQLQELDIPFDCLASHPQQDRMGAEAIVRRLVRSMKQGGQLTCVVSVTSSGRYGDIMAELCSRLGVTNLKTIAIYKLACVSDTVEALCQLDLDPANYPPGDCPLCKKGSTPITLHPGLYYLKDVPEKGVVLSSSYFSRTPQPQPQPPPQTQVSQSFFSWAIRSARQALDRFRPKQSSTTTGCMYDPDTFTAGYHTLKDLLSVHKDDRHQRHHAFHIDVGRLLEHPAFRKKLNAKLDGFKVKPDVIVTPSDAVSIRMGQIASERLKRPSIVVDSFRKLEHLTEAERALVQGRRNFLVLDDVLVSGSRLSGLNTELRERTERPASVSFLVGLGRPSSIQEWRKHEIALTLRLPWGASLEAVEQFYLPNWDERYCPWCREYEFLQEIAKPLPETPPWLNSRMARLTERELGIRDEPLWLLAGISPPRLGHGSPVGPEGMSAIATVFAFASALQRLRTDSVSPLKPHYPEFQVFDGRNLRNYSEGLLRASIMRVVLPKEWGATPLDENMTKELLAAAQRENQAVMLGELFLAIARRSFDRSLATSLKPILGSRCPDVYALLLGGLERV